MVFTVLGAVAELERSLIAERVRAGLRNARANGKRLGRPPRNVDAARIGRLHAQGRSVREIASELGYSRSLVHKTLAHGELFRVSNAKKRLPVGAPEAFYFVFRRMVAGCATCRLHPPLGSRFRS